MIRAIRGQITAHPLIAIVIALAVFAPAGALAWWLGAPLFISQTVNEDFPSLATADVPGNIAPADANTVMTTMAQVADPVAEPMVEPASTMAPDDVADHISDVRQGLDDVVAAVLGSAEEDDVAEMVEGVSNDLAAIESSLTEPPAAIAEPIALLKGNFFGADAFHQGSGDATVYELGTNQRVLRLENFEVTNGPDLRVLLAVHRNPFTPDELHDTGFVMLDKLKGNIGNQNYTIPPSVEIASMGSVIIYCYPFSVIFAVAPLAVS